jgi:hypothetical protein
MIKRKSKSKLRPLTSAARADGFGSVGLAWCAAALLLLSGCTVIPRLDANFDADPLGVPPSNPLPTPPNDSMNWRTEFVAASVVADSAGGRWVRVAALPAFTSSPDDRRVFLIAVTEPFTTNPPANMRGSVRLRLNNLATSGSDCGRCRVSKVWTSSEVSSWPISCLPPVVVSTCCKVSSLTGSATLLGFPPPARFLPTPPET